MFFDFVPLVLPPIFTRKIRQTLLNCTIFLVIYTVQQSYPMVRNASDPASGQDAQTALKKLEDTLDTLTLEENMKKKMLLKLLAPKEETDNKGGTQE